MFSAFSTYIKNNIFLSITGLYFVVSATFKGVTGIDFCIPCIWNLLFGFNCLGCGLTTAFISLIQLEIKSAFASNWLVFVILPVGIYYVSWDYLKFKKEYEASVKSQK